MRLPWARIARTAGDAPSRTELKKRLTPEQFRVTQQAGTERPFSGRYHDEKSPGTYRCIVCDAALFDSNAKYDSGTGWPSFSAAVDDANVSRHRDWKMIVPRTEVTCAGCDAHLGHVFSDGPAPSGERFCMNSAALRHDPR